MPLLEFYAVGADQRAVLDAVYGLGLFRVFEDYSQPDSNLREFLEAQDVPAGPEGANLMLYTVGAGPEPTAQRIDLQPSAWPGATFRHRCIGWGLIQLRFQDVVDGDHLRRSYTNHNTEKRAHKWADVTPPDLGVGDPSEWDWPAVTRASNALIRFIRKVAVTKIGAHPVLPHAAELIANGQPYER